VIVLPYGPYRATIQDSRSPQTRGARLPLTGTRVESRAAMCGRSSKR
jgi:hypothetical protein